jgi:hypothetical protein
VGFEVGHCIRGEDGEVYVGAVGGEDELGVVGKVELVPLLVLNTSDQEL